MIPPHRLFSAEGVPAKGSRALFQSVLLGLYFVQFKFLQSSDSSLALVCVPRRQQPAFIRSNSSIWSSTSLGPRLSGDVQSILRELYFVPIKCGALALAMICSRCQRHFACIHHNPSPLELLVQRLGHRSRVISKYCSWQYLCRSKLLWTSPASICVLPQHQFCRTKFSADQIHGLLCGI